MVAAGAMTFGNRWVKNFVEEIPKLSAIESKGIEKADPGDPKTYLVIGSDTRANVDTTDSQATSALCDPKKGCDSSARSDSMILVHVTPKEKSVFAVSIPRDLRVTVNGSKSKINSAFALGGAAGLVKALDENFHIVVNHIAVIDFQQFQEINRVVGGVHVPFPFPARDMRKENGREIVQFEWPKTGCVNLDPAPALAYVRSRFMQWYRNGRWQYVDTIPDIGRISRQQDYFRRLMQKAAGSAGDISDFMNLAERVKKFVQIDQSFTESDFLKLVNAMSAIDFGSNNGIEMTVFPWKDAGNGSDLLPEDSKWPDVVRRLNGEQLAMGSVSQTTLRVLNASGKDGLAKEVSDFMVSLGVKQGDPPTGNAPQLATRTVVKYATGMFAKAAQLKNFLGPEGQVDTIQDATLTDVDLEMVIGSDFKGFTNPATGVVERQSRVLQGLPAADVNASTSVPPTTARLSTTTTTTTTTTSVPYPAGYDPKALKCDP